MADDGTVHLRCDCIDRSRSPVACCRAAPLDMVHPAGNMIRVAPPDGDRRTAEVTVTSPNAVVSKARKRGPRGGRDAAALLVEAASQEFREQGFDGTDTNRIARRAGFAPQTFYRWFSDEVEIFVAVYVAWVGEVFARADALLMRNASDEELIDATIAHHRDYYVFRRSLRQLAVENDRVRKARADSRLQQIEHIRTWFGSTPLTKADLAIFILQHERLCDAIADRELHDLGVDEDVARASLQRLYREMRSKSQQASKTHPCSE
jgi:AcrR family transcriptional regulator